MRLDRQVVTDHALLTGVTAAQHHPPVETVRLIINATVIPSGAYLVQLALTYSGHQMARVILRGPQVMQVVGNEGCFIIATATANQASGFSLKKTLGSYTTSYIGGYSRIHGDSYVTEKCFGAGGYIALRNARINGSNLELEFFNTSAVNDTLTVYGTAICK